MEEDEFFDDDVFRRFEEMLNTNKNYFFDLDDFLEIIDEYMMLANYNVAKKAIDLALDQYPNNVDILLYKAEFYSLIDQLENAEKVIENIKQIEPNRVEIPLLEAELYSRKNMHQKAIVSLKKALIVAEDKLEVFEMLTLEYLYLENYKAALDTSLKSLDYDQGNATALYNAITCFDLLEETTQAIIFLKKQVKVQPFNEVAWSLLGKKYIEIYDYDLALEAFEFAIAIDDKFLGAYYDKAFVLSKKELFLKAINCYEQTLVIADPTAFTYYHLAKIFAQLDNQEAAVENYLLALHEDPGHVKSWIKLIKLKMDMQQYNEALVLSNKALDVIQNESILDLQSEIYLLLKQTDKAIQSLEKSLKLGMPRIFSILKLADLYKQTNQIEAYRNLLIEAKKQFPDSKDIKNRMLGADE